MARNGVKTGGRKRGTPNKRNVAAQVTAASILKKIDEQKAWEWALATAKKKRDVKTYIDALRYLTDRRDGKPRQAIDVGNDEGRPFKIISSIPRPDRDGSASNPNSNV